MELSRIGTLNRTGLIILGSPGFWLAPPNAAPPIYLARRPRPKQPPAAPARQLQLATPPARAGVNPDAAAAVGGQIRLVPPLQQALGWPWAFAFLALGPLVGVAAMAALRRSPGAARLAGGKG